MGKNFEFSGDPGSEELQELVEGYDTADDSDDGGGVRDFSLTNDNTEMEFDDDPDQAPGVFDPATDFFRGKGVIGGLVTRILEASRVVDKPEPLPPGMAADGPEGQPSGPPPVPERKDWGRP